MIGQIFFMFNLKKIGGRYSFLYFFNNQKNNN